MPPGPEPGRFPCAWPRPPWPRPPPPPGRFLIFVHLLCCANIRATQWRRRPRPLCCRRRRPLPPRGAGEDGVTSGLTGWLRVDVTGWIGVRRLSVFLVSRISMASRIAWESKVRPWVTMLAKREGRFAGGVTSMTSMVSVLCTGSASFASSTSTISVAPDVSLRCSISVSDIGALLAFRFNRVLGLILYQ